MKNKNAKKSKNNILSDHKQVGKRFVPPLMQIGPLHEVKWIDYILPELLWLALLNSSYNLKKGASLALNISRAASKAYGKPGVWFAPISSYASLTIQQQKEVSKILTPNDLNMLKGAISPLAEFYPECPLKFLYEEPPITNKRETQLTHFKKLLSRLFDRHDKEATFMQANAIYIAFDSDILRVQKGLALANFPAVADFPRTEESIRVASAVQASINGFMGNEHFNKKSFWPNYFWKRGFELEPCSFESI